jgi:hypothetical protein
MPFPRRLGLLVILWSCSTATERGGARIEPGSGDLESPDPLGEQEEWVFMQSHLHTTAQHDCANNPTDPGPGPKGACYSPEGIHAFLQDALDHDASGMIITDHNNVDAWFDPAFSPLANESMTAYATPLRGMEWSSGQGHMTVFFPRRVVASNAEALSAGWIWTPGNHVEATEADYTAAIARVHGLGGMVFINHPELYIHRFPDTTLGADAVEVGVAQTLLNDMTGGITTTSLHTSKLTRLWWQRRLAAGDRITGISGSDHHHGSGDMPGLKAKTFGVAVNLVRIDPALPNEADVALAVANPQTTIDQQSDLMADAVRRGHVMVVEDEDAARVYLGADLDGDGRHRDAREGDCILPTTFGGTSFEVQVRITQPSSTVLSKHYNALFWTADSIDRPAFRAKVYADDGFEEQPDLYTIDPDDPFVITIRVPFDPARRQFLRVELERDVLGPINDTEVVTNPIYFGNWGPECAGSEVLY